MTLTHKYMTINTQIHDPNTQIHDPNTQIHDGSLSWLGTDTYKSGGNKLVLWS
jgi:hypothetical protein